MATFAVTSEELSTQSSRVGIGAADVEATLTRLSSEIANLAASWQGGASQAFQTRWQEWQAGAKQVQEAMANMGTFLQEAATQYETTEEGLRSAAGR
jgi:WXG100 family type VII secretion target